MKPEFVYTIYIKATAEKIWEAITDPRLTHRYWGHDNVSDWKKGSRWQHIASDEKHTVRIVGEVLESVPPKRLVLTWAEAAGAPAKSGHSRVTFEIDTVEGMARLTVTHSDLEAGSAMDRKVRSGWPRVLSSMKSFLETGTALDTWSGRDRDVA